MKFIIASKSKLIAVECSSREKRLRRLKTTLTTPRYIHKTNMHKLTDNSPINNTPRNTANKPRPALNTQEDLLTPATGPLDQVKTHKMEYNMFNADRTLATEYEEYVEYGEYEEFDTKEYITTIGEIFVPRLWTHGGCNQEEFQAFTHQWSLYRGCHSGMDDRELRYQLLDSINGPLEDAMYEIFGSKIYTIPDTILLEELEEVAVKCFIRMFQDHPDLIQLFPFSNDCKTIFFFGAASRAVSQTVRTFSQCSCRSAVCFTPTGNHEPTTLRKQWRP